MLAVVTVDTPLDVVDFSDHLTSLREAIFAANTVPGPDEIVFDFGRPNLETILLTQGELHVTDSLKITGPGAERLTIDASGNDPTPQENNGDGSRVFFIYPNGADEIRATISGLTLTGGDAVAGGALYADADRVPLYLNIFETVIKNNAATDTWTFGGGVWVESSIRGGAVHIRDTQFVGNEANGHWAWGGGLAVNTTGTMTVENSSFQGNRASGTWAWGGGMAIDRTGDLIVQNNAFQSNRASGSWAWGGGAFIEALGGEFNTISGNSIYDNTADGRWSHGGGIAVEALQAEITFRGNQIARNLATGNGGRGGGISVEAGSGDTIIRLLGNQIRQNEAASGGGVYFEPDRHNGGIFQLNQESIFENTARSHGGGLYFEGIAAGYLSIRDSAVFENHASNDGAGIFSLGDIDIVNSTISTNTSNVGRGGGLFNIGSLDIQSSTISGNTARYGGGIYHGGFEDRTSLTSSIVATNHASVESPDMLISAGSIVNISYSLIGDNSGSTFSEAPVGSPDTNGNVVGGAVHGAIDPLLGELAANGGPTRTHALRSGSPAIDAGDPGFTPPPEFDQRGKYFARVYDGDGVDGARIDMGAVEVQPILPTAIGDYWLDGLVNLSDYLIWRGTLGSVTDLRADGNGNSVIDTGDYEVWKANFGSGLRLPATPSVNAFSPIEAVADGDPPSLIPVTFTSTTAQSAPTSSDRSGGPKARKLTGMENKVDISLLSQLNAVRIGYQNSTDPSTEALDTAFSSSEREESNDELLDCLVEGALRSLTLPAHSLNPAQTWNASATVR